MKPLEQTVSRFVEHIAANKVEIYNEFSLQHEFGIFLRAVFPDCRVQFERNITHFFELKKQFIKKEIDISIFRRPECKLLHAFELKYPRNGQYPEQMFSFCKDIVFAEQLCEAGFETTGLLVFADDPLFYSGTGTGVYEFFRGHKPIHGIVAKPTGRKDERIYIRGEYVVRWHPIKDNLMYALVEINEDSFGAKETNRTGIAN